jgi:hypothetical protein
LENALSGASVTQDGSVLWMGFAVDEEQELLLVRLGTQGSRKHFFGHDASLNLNPAVDGVCLP